MTAAGDPAIEAKQVLRVFVAMPGSNMGEGAVWADPDQIKRRLYERVRDVLAEKLGRPIELIIEKDKDQPGSIYSSMYSEAWIADVYLVDLTGANANVYLELGVRWAMSDGVTVLLAQNPAKLPFNVVAARAQPYSSDPDFLENSIDRIVRSVLAGLEAKRRGKSDSPVRESAEFQTVPVAQIQELKSKLVRLETEYGENYLRAATEAPTLQARIDFLRLAVGVNPLAPESQFRLGQALRETGEADSEAIEHLREAARLSPSTPGYWRELGVALSKSGQPATAVPALESCIKLDPTDFDAISVLGGAKRRLALKGAPDSVDWEMLRASRDLYQKASEIAPRDTYPLLNVARIDLLLSVVEPERAAEAQARFRKAQPLCQFEWQYAKEEADKNGGRTKYKIAAGYKAFDFADCFLFSGQLEEGLKTYREAVEYIPAELRADILRSVAGALSSTSNLVSFDESTRKAIDEARAIISI